MGAEILQLERSFIIIAFIITRLPVIRITGSRIFAIGWVFYFTIQVSPAMIMSRREPKPFDDEI